jgi:hypothetical protein
MRKKFRVYFAMTSFGPNGVPVMAALQSASDAHGQHLPPVSINEDRYQIRDLVRVGMVWGGSFAKLRSDAPHIVDSQNTERQIELDAGDSILEKCYFQYRENSNLIVWQNSRNTGGLSRAADYMSQIFGGAVTLPQIQNQAELEKVLNGQLYEVEFDYARTPSLPLGGDVEWSQHAMDMMAPIDAARARFMLRAPRGGSLTARAGQFVREMLGTAGTEKIRVRISAEDDPIDLFMAPLRDTIELSIVDGYPQRAEALAELEAAYDRNRKFIGTAA